MVKTASTMLPLGTQASDFVLKNVIDWLTRPPEKIREVFTQVIQADFPRVRRYCSRWG